MNQHVGPTYALSVAIVVAFAVLLHKSESPTKPPPATTPPTRRADPIPVTSAPRRTGRPQAEVTVRRPPASPMSTTKPASVVIKTSFGGKATTDPAGPTPALPRTQKKASRRGGFTTVGRGESLGDVAARVYGSATDADGLWRSNRDQLPAREAPLREGMLLRTP